MLHTYGPYGPNLLSNGPAIIECQGRWIVDCMKLMEREGVKYINPTDEASKAWKKRVNDLSDGSLFPKVLDYDVHSTYMGGSIPGKAYEQVNYPGGIPQYRKELREKNPGFKGFKVVKV